MRFCWVVLRLTALFLLDFVDWCAFLAHVVFWNGVYSALLFRDMYVYVFVPGVVCLVLFLFLFCSGFVLLSFFLIFFWNGLYYSIVIKGWIVWSLVMVRRCLFYFCAWDISVENSNTESEMIALAIFFLVLFVCLVC